MQSIRRLKSTDDTQSLADSLGMELEEKEKHDEPTDRLTVTAATHPALQWTAVADRRGKNENAISKEEIYP